MQPSGNKTGKIVLLYGFLVVALLLFLAAIAQIIFTDRDLPTLETKKLDSAVRGGIYSQDGFHLASSKKLYKAIINTYCLNLNKKEMFIRLFSIYSGLPESEIRQSLRDQGNVVLSYNINTKTASHLKQLAKKLNSMNMFIEHEDNQGRVYKYGLSIIESGEKREYLYEDSFEPALGYVRKKEEKGLTRVSGVKGVEKYYEKYLNPIQDGILEGSRDVGFNIIINKEGELKERTDGYDLILNIHLKLQKKLERIVDEARRELGAKEIIACVMGAQSGKILSLATSGRFDPNNIGKKDYPYLNTSASEYSFEPGSVIKPVVFSLLLEHGLINPLETIKLYNGRYRIGKKVITDTHPEESSLIKEVIIHSSNIGMAQLAQKLDPVDYYSGLQRFGFSKLSGIDLPYEANGVIPSVNRLRHEIYKATVAYGYGLRATFMQILSAYNVFNNHGLGIHPQLAAYIQDTQKNHYQPNPHKPQQILKPATAKKMQQILVETVLKGTGQKAQVEGIEVGGKTGTAHIAEKGQYINRYNSSFFGFANGKKNRFTIGVVVFEPEESKEYFASQTAVPVFKKAIELLIQERFLTPTETTPSDAAKMSF